MKKTKFIFLKLNTYTIPFTFILFTLFLIIFSKGNMLAVKSALELLLNSVIPSLFPFFVATELLHSTNLINNFGNILNKFMKPLFNVPGEGAFALIMGIISGYPIGAKIVSDFKCKNICTSEECERLLAFTNNSGPLFIVGTVGIGFFGDVRTGFLLLFTHILACISVGICFRFWKSKRNAFSYIPSSQYRSYNPTVSFSNLGEIISGSIMSAIRSTALVCGFIILFSVVCSILNNIFSLLNISNPYVTSFITSLFEVTNGLHMLSTIKTKAISINIILTSFLLSLGGVCIFLQVLSITSKNNISIKTYIAGKLLQACFASLYTFLILNNFRFFSLNL